MGLTAGLGGGMQCACQVSLGAQEDSFSAYYGPFVPNLQPCLCSQEVLLEQQLPLVPGRLLRGLSEATAGKAEGRGRRDHFLEPAPSPVAVAVGLGTVGASQRAWSASLRLRTHPVPLLALSFQNELMQLE